MTEYERLSPRDESSGGQPDALSPEELARYRELLTLAYPQPKRDLRAAVLAEIQRESGAKLLRQKKNARKAFVRWGSLAACAVLVILIGTAALPDRLMKSASQDASAVASDSAYADDYAAPAAAAEEEAFETTTETAVAGFPAKSNDFDAPAAPEAPLPEPAEAPAENAEYNFATAEEPEVCEEAACEEAVCEEDAICADVVCEEAIVWKEAVETVEAEEERSANDFAASEGFAAVGSLKAAAIPAVENGAHVCECSASFRDSYHAIPAALIALVEEEAWHRWQDDRFALGECANLVDFAIAFGLSGEQINETGNLWYYLDVPEGIPFTAENRDALRDYYRVGGSYAEMVRRYTEYEVKTALIVEVGVSAYTSWAETSGRNSSSFRTWTVGELAEAFFLPADSLRTAYDRAAAAVAAEYPGYAIPSYDEITAE